MSLDVTLRRLGTPKRPFREIGLFKPFEYYDTLYIKLSTESALAVVQGTVESIAVSAPVYPVSQIHYRLED